jgi:hypothetical protein
MKLKNLTAAPVQVFDEHTGKGALVEPGGETPELSEQTARELAEHTAIWAPVASVKPAVRTSGRSKKES